MNGRRYAVRAVALGPDMVTGVPAIVSGKTPTLAAQLITAALTATNDYLKVLGQQQRVTITTEGLTIIQSSPDFWPHLFQHITDVVGISAMRAESVEIAEVAPTTDLRLLILTVEGW